MCYSCNPLSGRFVLNEARSLPYDLKEEFEKANRLYFDGELKPVYMRYRNIKSPFGYVKVDYLFHRKTKRVVKVNRIIELVITSKYKMSRQRFLDTFYHELCHLYMYQNYKSYTWEGGSHGKEWQELAAEINAKAGTNIKQYGDPKEYESRQVKPYVVIRVKRNDGKYFFAHMSKKGFSRVDKASIESDRYESIEAMVLTDGFIKNYFTGTRSLPITFRGTSDADDLEKINSEFENGTPIEFPSDPKVKPYALLYFESRLAPNQYGLKKFKLTSVDKIIRTYKDDLSLKMILYKRPMRYDMIMVKTDSTKLNQYGFSRKADFAFYLGKDKEMLKEILADGEFIWSNIDDQELIDQEKIMDNLM